MQPVSPTGKTRFFVTYSTDRVIGRFYYIVGIQLSKGEKISIANKKNSNSFLLAFWIVVVFIRQIYLVTSSLSKHERNSYRKFFIGNKSNIRRSVSSLRRESKIRRAAEYFRRTSRVPSPDETLCRTLDTTSQTKGFYQKKLRMQKWTVFHLISKHSLNIHFFLYFLYELLMSIENHKLSTKPNFWIWPITARILTVRSDLRWKRSFLPVADISSPQISINLPPSQPLYFYCLSFTTATSLFFYLLLLNHNPFFPPPLPVCRSASTTERWSPIVPNFRVFKIWGDCAIFTLKSATAWTS